MESYSSHFVYKTKNVQSHASSYLHGLVQCPNRKNGYTMQSHVADCVTYDNLNHFISKALWDRRGVFNSIARNVNELLGSSDSVLIIDESGFPKKGTKSAGVSRQWLGCQGKVDNGQVGVFSALCHGENAALIDADLYLPEVWTKDSERCKKAGIPEDKQTFRTKDEIAVLQVKRAINNGVEFGWTSADAGYSKGFTFIHGLITLEQSYVVDLHSDMYVYLEKPVLGIPEKKGTRGKAPTKERFLGESCMVRDLRKRVTKEEWKTIRIRQGTKGDVTYSVAIRKVWIVDTIDNTVHEQQLIIRDEANSKFKYSLSNNMDADRETLARVQAQRYWIERAFQDGKQKVGLGDYESTKWLAWYGHVALALVAGHFMLLEKLRALETEEPILLSISQIQQLLALFLPRKEVKPEDIMSEIEEQARIRYKIKQGDMTIYGVPK